VIPSSLRQGLQDVFLCVAVCLAGPAHAGVDVDVALDWRVENLAGKMQVYTLAPEKKVPLWQTRVVGTLAETPAGALLPAGHKLLRKGQNHRFVLVYKNEAPTTEFFFAAPHAVDPAESSLGFKFKCLCVNRAYEVPAGKVWYRVVELRLAKNMVGDRLAVSHTLVGIDKSRAEEFSHDSESGDR
jgi:hypothetical protein